MSILAGPGRRTGKGGERRLRDEGEIDMSIWDAIATERLRLADELEGLTDEQWHQPSQCAEWTIGEMASHLIVPFEVSTPRFVLAMARNRGNFDRTMRWLAISPIVHSAHWLGWCHCSSVSPSSSSA
ncbi:MAG: maleylpyruvate isomerase N-terminal domain-containing protein, partial [Actinomycetota bacterium]